MGIDRRGFLKTMGLVGVTLTVGKSFGAVKEQKKDREFSGILYDSTLCIGCQNCEYTCADHYGLTEPKDSPVAGVTRNTSANQRVAINLYKTSRGEKYVRKACMHCNEPACASACLTKAMYKTEEGPVIWRENKCIGCRSCMISCPFEMPKFDFNSPNPVIQKCRMCYELLRKGKKPVCVDACPQEALIFGKRRDLIEIAKTRIYADPEKYHHAIYGENEVGGTGVLYIGAVPFEELGFRTDLGTVPYPEKNKTFLYSVPAVLILWPAFLLGLHNSFNERKRKLLKEKYEQS